jgi:hypothetical protein
MSGTIGVLSSELARYADFSIALMHLNKPAGTRLAWTKGVNVVNNMNRMVTQLHGDWLWVLGDDHVFDPDLLVRLLTHDVDVVVPLCLKHSPPYDPVVYSHQNENGEYVGHTDLPESGLHPIYAAGTAGMLIRRHVLDALQDPVFETHGGLNEDLTFCAKVRAAGFRIWCDVDSPLGHLSQISVWPTYEDGQWQIGLNLGNGETFKLRRFLREPVAA